MAKQKYYAVAKGRMPGIYTNWDHCKAQVDKFSNATYKSFPTEGEARAYLRTNGIGSKLPLHETEIKQTKTEPVATAIKSKANVKIYKKYMDPDKFRNTHDYICFVDGSYDKKNQIYGSGIAVLSQIDNGYYPLLTAGIDVHNQWNIVGELEATLFALKNAVNVAAEKVVIYHDLANIALWAVGEYKAKNAYTQNYVRQIEEYSKKLDITFVKVKGHSDNVYNDAADMLAKRAIELYKAKENNEEE